MWNKPWKLKEGFVIGGGLVLTGLLLQITSGPVVWSIFSFPVNVVAPIVFLALIIIAYAFRDRVYAFRFSGSYMAAIPALTYAAVLTIIMGLTRQVADDKPAADVLGFTRMLSCWPFVLSYLWMAFILGQVVLKRFFALCGSGHNRCLRRDIPFFLNHLGLFVTMVSATLGHADMQRLKMTVTSDGPEWRAFDDNGQMHELPIAIQLEEFRIDEYPPKLILVDSKTGSSLGGKQAGVLVVDSGFTQGRLGEWTITVDRRLDYATPVMREDTTYYDEWMHTGAVSAVGLTARKSSSPTVASAEVSRSGWVSCGSYMFPEQLLPLDEHTSIAMPQREPQRFVSRVEILTKTNKDIKTDILVNKPFSIDGWKVYQLNYDTRKGRWSDISILELVSDPWLPVVYGGIFMMLLGTVCMFLSFHRESDRASSAS